MKMAPKSNNFIKCNHPQNSMVDAVPAILYMPCVSRGGITGYRWKTTSKQDKSYCLIIAQWKGYFQETHKQLLPNSCNTTKNPRTHLTLKRALPQLEYISVEVFPVKLLRCNLKYSRLAGRPILKGSGSIEIVLSNLEG